MSLRIDDAVIWNETANGIALYHTESGEFRSLNETGAKIWVLVESDGDREQVITKLSLLFAGRNAALGERIRAEVDQFISSMVESGLLAEDLAAVQA
ncbi:PqqD family protein [Actinoplanes sp. NPDC051475]|uniref:PqqD family protein n=1 Tax=Actinoplanes sp. NPDC051475 TaxID=3157225 RepID=UPI0034510A2B